LGRVDTPWRYTGVFELAAILVPKIEMASSLPPKFGHHLGTDLVATGADAGADGGVQVLGTGAKALGHAPDSSLNNAGSGTPPSGMYGSDRPSALVSEQDGHAVGGLDGDHGMRAIFKESVGLSEDAAPALGRDARGGMYLFDGGEPLETGGDIGVAGSEAVNQPGKRVEVGGSVDVVRIEIKQG
jgi:hypothetical protein